MPTFQSHVNPEQILVKSLEKFPSTNISWNESEQYPQVYDRLDPEEKLILFQHCASINIPLNGVPLEILIHPKWNEPPLVSLDHFLMIKCFWNI